MKQNKVKKRLNSCDKFTFSIEFQLEVLRFLIQGKESLLYIPKIKPGYFTLIEHSILVEALIKFVKKYQRIPSEVLMIEQVKTLLEGKDYTDLVTKEDIPNIHKLISELYNKPLKDVDIVLENIHKFIAYIELKALNESMDFSDYNSYEIYQAKLTKILQNSKPQKKDEPLLMVSGTAMRQLMRKVDPDIVPTPFWQLNKLGNGDGYPKNSLFVLIDRPKRRKTFALINIARGYLAMKKNVLYIDTENGKNQLMDRMIQSTLNKTKREMLTGDYDKMEQRHMRKYKRLGVEFIVERVPATIADCNTIKNLVRKLESEKGIKVHVIIIDYAAKLASISRDKDDVERINNVYIDIDNMGDELGLDAIWTAQHVTREGAKHQETRYEDNDIASAISIIRNAKCVMGLNSTQDEEEHNIMRMEVVVQRDGVPTGRVMFNMDPERQRMKEFSKEARAKYDESMGKQVDDMLKKKKKVSNPNANPEKRSKTTGDI
jgi:phosphate uptake regulator|nr:MAG TPA: DnaB-like replicative helicase [Herelleviridae sp.]